MRNGKSKTANIMVILGTRPEATKLAPVILELRRPAKQFNVKIIATGQHREMLSQALGVFGLKPDINCDIMRREQSLEHITSAALSRLDPILGCERPDLVLVEGDATTVLAAALAAFYHHVAVAHLEAGLRTEERYNPFPEEMNRRLTSVLASLHLAPTPGAKNNLLKEGHVEGSIYVTGNTAVDAVLWCASQPPPDLPKTSHGAKVILVTTHRRESWGEPLKRICETLAEIARRFSDTEIVFPVHPNPKVKGIVKEVLKGRQRIHLVKPMDYMSFVHMMKKSYIILSDSGGIQEEAPSLDKPVLVLRENTERPEGLVAGTSKLVGTNTAKIVSEVRRLLCDEKAYASMARARNPFGDGRAAKRVREAILHYLGMRKRRPMEFKGVVRRKSD
ncbi:MAG: UDP-N-acetylglucosamine 2-epimerase (non-hydrolyzing) [Armatimonadetes bacterium]|nr:UDP-N-acetylglucosamine 2-epimerase (non-hydrolyzing) [Armatimonadota bacterium]NIM23147.1 UDP-N-acetylglucosamine 2-epimerase (non-hydrolyzing) [Armatimonadota bacterium]NIM67015.1 UDP-N-acetylglucosamine 2-epimerase (non-hydrolyzing) [Armatimonadota bacterium]NIM75549.1 UDP-N-acetylglucosamine 2-epimerase (non-hydrolyzing) [Armatimonadota bacterium]NIN05204.1 UDP-N-acetylglucosamine 2-epimerase (non-hydrolyzing) [Armatimonadota bacterium]